MSDKPVRGIASMLVTVVACWAVVAGLGCLLAGQWVCAATVLPTAVYVLFYQHQAYRWSDPPA